MKLSEKEIAKHVAEMDRLMQTISEHKVPVAEMNSETSKPYVAGVTVLATISDLELLQAYIDLVSPGKAATQEGQISDSEAPQNAQESSVTIDPAS